MGTCSVSQCHESFSGRHAGNYHPGMPVCVRVGRLLLVLLLAAAGQICTAVAVPPSKLAILIVSDASDPRLEARARALSDRLQELKALHGYADGTLPIMTYHLDRPSERAYCAKQLGVHAEHVLFVGIVLLRDRDLPQRPVRRFERVRDVNKTAAQVMRSAFEVLSLARISTSKTTWLGLQLRNLAAAGRTSTERPREARVEVVGVLPHSPAEKAGIQVRDLLLEIDGRRIASIDGFQESTRAYRAGNQVQINLYRPGVGTLVKIVTVEPLPRL